MKASTKPKTIKKKKPLADIDDNVDDSFMDVYEAKNAGGSDSEGQSVPSTSKAPAATKRQNKTASEMYQQVGMHDLPL